MPRIGGHKSVIFAPPPALLPDEIPKRPAPLPEQNALLHFADLLRDSNTVSGLAKNLLTDRPGMHGNLQSILSMSRQIQKTAEALISHMEAS